MSGIAWSIENAAREFGPNHRTLSNRLVQAGIKPDETGHYTTKQIAAAVFGDLDGEKLRKMKGEADAIDMENRKTRGELVEVVQVVELIQRACFAARQKILMSGMTDKEKNAVLLELSALKDADYTKIDESLQDTAT